MSLSQITWALLSVVPCGLWLFLLVRITLESRELNYFDDLTPAEPESWPLLSVIVAACNEAHTIRPAIQSLLEQTYPNLEFVLVNDRSSDQTGEILDEIAKMDSRVHVVHISELPEGWLGKVHALHQGVQLAKGDFLLFTDADVHFGGGALEKAVAYAVQGQLDHLTILPRPLPPSILFEATLMAFGGMFLSMTKAHKIQRGEPGSVAGCGAFNLVRRRCLDQSLGFPWIKLELADDVGLGLVLKKAGAKADFLLTRHAFSVLWYPNLKSMIKGLEKNAYPLASRFNPLRWSLQILAACLFFAGPLLSFLPWQLPLVWIGGASVLAFLFGFASLAHLEWKRSAQSETGYSAHPFLAALLLPVGFAILTLILFNSGFQCLRRGGITWRGTFYPTHQLRSGQRLIPPYP